MAMTEDLMIANHIKTEKFKTVDREFEVEFEVDSFDFGGRFEMDFDAGF